MQEYMCGRLLPIPIQRLPSILSAGGDFVTQADAAGSREGALCRQARGVDVLLPLAWAAVLALFVAGCLLPAIAIRAWFIRTSETSILDAVLTLFREGHVGLALVIAVFAGLVPMAKMGMLALLWMHPDPHGRGFRRLMAASAGLGRWSMLDVFVLALVVFAVQSQGLASAKVLPGAYCFAAAALLSIALTYRMQALMLRVHAGEAGPIGEGGRR